MKRLLLGWLLLTPALSMADGLSLQVNTVSRHFPAFPEDQEFNEHNHGAGLQYDFAARGRVTPLLAGGTLINSIGTRSWYIGGGHRYRLLSNELLHLDAGYFAGLLTYPRRAHFVHVRDFTGRSFIQIEVEDPNYVRPAFLPTVELGGDRLALVAVIVPKIPGAIDSAAVLLQVRISF